MPYKTMVDLSPTLDRLSIGLSKAFEAAGSPQTIRVIALNEGMGIVEFRFGYMSRAGLRVYAWRTRTSLIQLNERANLLPELERQWIAGAMDQITPNLAVYHSAQAAKPLG